MIIKGACEKIICEPGKNMIFKLSYFGTIDYKHT